jgi:hypothetical protein
MLIIISVRSPENLVKSITSAEGYAIFSLIKRGERLKTHEKLNLQFLTSCKTQFTKFAEHEARALFQLIRQLDGFNDAERLI